MKFLVFLCICSLCFVFTKQTFLRGFIPTHALPPQFFEEKLNQSFRKKTPRKSDQASVQHQKFGSARRMKMDSGRIPFLAGGCFLERLKV